MSATPSTPPAGALPNALPRPPGELEQLQRAWRLPRGLAFVTAVNNNVVGLLYVATALLFFLLAGILGLIMRAQLALPENDLVSADRYNQLFTMHGTVMMFLFAVPAMEAMGVLLLPNMLGARDLPFPRLSAYAYWMYLVGGLFFFGSLFFDVAPRGGWFMYPPLTTKTYSPGISEDFWLLGIGFIEISAIAGAIEIIVGVLRTRAPGMTLARMPVFAWAMLVFAVMIVFAFPAIILSTVLLEIERAFGWPFFAARQGGDALLWQHLFWFFGHPEVYIIFLPAAGMVSMILPAMAGTPLVGHRLVVLAMVGTGFLSFGLWVHHMFATGMPRLSLSYFSAASMAVAVPSGIQVFAWIATLAAARRLQWKTPLLFVLGFLFIFVLGGLTGVMVAVVPFNWQTHDTYFIVAHFHYVLFGGMVFPLFAAFYYWMPYTSRRALSERLGRWVFALVFIGFNVTFFPMHVSGLLGMPRRVYTYPAGLGWEILNLVSTLGAFLIAAGVLLFLFDLARNFRYASEGNAGNVWQAGTLEWLPSGNYGTRSIPAVTSREPLWDQPQLAQEVEAGRWYLPGTRTGYRETLVTSTMEAQPQAVLALPGPGWDPWLAAVCTAAFFAMLTVQHYIAAVLFALAALVFVLRWLWGTDRRPGAASADIGAGSALPLYVSGAQSHSRWAMVVLMLVAGSVYASLVFSYLYLWTVSPQVWPHPDALPDVVHAIVSAALIALAGAAMAYAKRALDRGTHAHLHGAAGAASALLLGALGVELWAQHEAGLVPAASAYGAIVYTFVALQAFYAVVLAAMAFYVVTRSRAGLLDRQQRNTFDNTRLFWHYSLVQTFAGIALVHAFPRLVAA